jgi:hypothetical protein
MAGRKHLVCPARWPDKQNTQNAGLEPFTCCEKTCPEQHADNSADGNLAKGRQVTQ